MTHKKRNFLGMSYREVQRWNSDNRKKLNRQQQKNLKEQGFRNIGWESVIELYLVLETLIKPDPEPESELGLEELFLEASRIGDKYQTDEDRANFQEKFNREIAEIDQLIEGHFPESPVLEFIDYSKSSPQRKS